MPRQREMPVRLKPIAQAEPSKPRLLELTALLELTELLAL
ncbi:deoxyribonuclease V [Bifidobacterium gallicum DSM 20093 = LMG 11596]|nr:deoxyribonuclease V [Bifidobacterium gallicum DSM 20093 = LMG 11596]